MSDEVERPATFTREEKQRIMEIVEAHKRAKWLWASVAVWAKWIAAVGAAVAMLKVGFIDVAKVVIQQLRGN